MKQLVLALTAAAVLATSAGLSACRDLSASCDQCGVIQSINKRAVKGEANPGSAVAGAIVGGIVGHQFGSGKGNALATAAGAVGGAIIGTEIERERNSSVVYDVAVRMNDGDVRRLTIAKLGDLRTGDKVQIKDGRLVHAT